MTQATIVQVNTYLADNNIKTSQGSATINITNTNGVLTTYSVSVLPNNGTYTYIPASGNLISVITTNLPLSVSVTYANAAVFSNTITSIFVCDMSITQIVFTNPSTTDAAALQIISG